MFGRKILFLAAGYLAGNVVSSVYSGGKKKAKKDGGKQDFKIMIENFLDTHKSFAQDIEKKYLPQEQQEKFTERKKQFLKASKKYIKQGEKLLSEVSENETFIAGKSKTQGIITGLFQKSKTVIGEIKDDILDKKTENKK